MYQHLLSKRFAYEHQTEMVSSLGNLPKLCDYLRSMLCPKLSTMPRDTCDGMQGTALLLLGGNRVLHLHSHPVQVMFGV